MKDLNVNDTGLGSSFTLRLNKEWWPINNESPYYSLRVVSKVTSPLYQRILNKVTFGLYKLNKFTYNVEYEKEGDSANSGKI